MNDEQPHLPAPLRAASIGELFNSVKEAQSRLFERGEAIGGKELWYRGVPRGHYELVPSLLRFLPRELEATERQLYKQFLEHGVPKKPGWHTLFEMQHYFIPTRLLDWTTSLGVALHFALNSDEPLDNPVIWILHSGLLNAQALPERLRTVVPLEQYQPLSVDDLERLQLGYFDTYLEKNRSSPQLPLAIVPELAFPRLRAQRGRFTVHGQCFDPLEKICPDAVERIVISNAAIESIKDQISLTGIDALSIFPDAVGLADYLRRYHSLTPIAGTKTLVTKLAAVWKEDCAKLIAAAETPNSPVPQLSIRGIENCAVSSDYLKREGGDTAVERQLKTWLGADEGGIRVLVGEAGSGKTNCLLNAIMDGNIYEKRTVIWFPLFRFKPHQTLLQNLHDDLCATFVNPGANLTHALAEVIRKSDTILILDGLDELSRTKGRDAAGALARALRSEIFEEQGRISEFPKVLVSCRRDIYDNIKRTFGPEDTKVLGPVEPLRRTAITAKLSGASPEGVLPEFLARYPIFLRFLSQASLPNPIPTTPNKLFAALAPGETQSSKQENLRKLGRIAKEMLSKRQDYLNQSDFQGITNKIMCSHFFEPRPLQVLLTEKNSEDVRFLHHTIREFVLAWNIHDSLTSTTAKEWDMLLEQADLDYEGAEVHRAVSELDPVPDWGKIKQKCEEIANWDRRNNFAWCCFETAGMLGVPKSDRDLVLGWLGEALQEPLDGKDSRYSFKTKYNAARCLERLHPSGPDCYWKWITERSDVQSRKTSSVGPDENIFDGNAVRGFQRSQLEITRTSALMRGSRGQIHEDPYQLKFSQILIDGIEHLSSYQEISRRQLHVLVNMSFALIRWYSVRHRNAIEDLLTKVLDDRVTRNLHVALSHWHTDRVE